MNKGLQVIGRAHDQPTSPHLIFWTSNLASSPDAQPPSSNSQRTGPTAAISANMSCKRSDREDCGMFCPCACVAVGIGVWLILVCTCSDKGIFCRKDADNTGGTLVADNCFVIFTDNIDTEFLCKYSGLESQTSVKKTYPRRFQLTGAVNIKSHSRIESFTVKALSIIFPSWSSMQLYTIRSSATYTRVWRCTLLSSSLTSVWYIHWVMALIQRWALFRPARKWVAVGENLIGDALCDLRMISQGIDM
jgi:hypothetical protein